MSSAQRFLDSIFGDHELTTITKRIVSIALMVLAVIMAWMPQEKSASFFAFWKDTEKVRGYTPDLLTALIALLIILPLYVRNIFKWQKTSVYSLMAFGLNLALCATFFKIILGGEGFAFNYLTVALAFSMVLAWAGMRPVALVAWVAIFIIAIIKIQVTNQTFGSTGFLFVLFGFLGLLLHAEVKPRDLVVEMKCQFMGSIENPMAISTEVNYSRRSVAIVNRDSDVE